MADKTNCEKKLQEIEEKLEEGIRNVYSNEMPAYLAAMAKFPHYSANNCILIITQKPETTGMVCGMKKWNEMGRKVMKNEKGIMILAPIKHKADIQTYVYNPDGTIKKDASGKPIKEMKAQEYMTFRPVYVFDYCQTEGDPIPEIVHTLTADVEDFPLLMQAVIDVSPVPVEFATIEGGANGYYSPAEKKIVVKSDLPQMQMIKTLLHEESHATLGHGSDEDKTERNVKEVTAEASAYMCACMLGLEGVESYSAGYLVSWSRDREVSELKENLETIKKTAEKIYDKVSVRFRELKEVSAEHENKEHGEQEDEEVINAGRTEKDSKVNQMIYSQTRGR